MYAIIESGGKQYRVEEGNLVRLEKLEASVGEEVVFDRVVALKDESEFKVGDPYLENVKVVGKVTSNGKGKKIIVFKYKPKINYKRKKGHRQPYSEVRINKIETP